jgi:hypothetical protein
MRKLFGVLTGAAMLALVGVANGGERVKTLTDAQLDNVVAGNFAEVDAVGFNVEATGIFNVQSSTTNALAGISVTFNPSGTGTPQVVSLLALVTVP